MGEREQFRFMKLLVSGETASLQGREFIVKSTAGRSGLPEKTVQALAARGLVTIAAMNCRAKPEARSWLKRRIADRDHYAAQHRTLVAGADDSTLNLNESPLAKLAHSTNGRAAFLDPHHLLAGERIRSLFERAHLIQRTTMSYDPSRLPGASAGPRWGSVSDMVIDARKSLAQIESALPADCAGVVLDVCGNLKGLQQVETERRWPRRSAKLVLRIGLEQTASHFGLSPVASGEATRRDHNWLGEGARPTEYG